MERKGNEIKKVVMTGGSGPIGLALIQKLLEEHVEVFLFQREHSFRSAFVPEHEHLHIEHYTLEQLKDYEPEENDYDVFFIWAGQIQEKLFVIISRNRVKMSGIQVMQ